MTLEQNNFRKWADVQPGAALQTGAAVSAWRVGAELFGNRLQQARGRGGGVGGGGQEEDPSLQVCPEQGICRLPPKVCTLFRSRALRASPLPLTFPTPKDNLSLASDARPA